MSKFHRFVNGFTGVTQKGTSAVRTAVRKSLPLKGLYLTGQLAVRNSLALFKPSLPSLIKSRSSGSARLNRFSTNILSFVITSQSGRIFSMCFLRDFSRRLPAIFLFVPYGFGSNLFKELKNLINRECRTAGERGGPRLLPQGWLLLGNVPKRFKRPLSQMW